MGLLGLVVEDMVEISIYDIQISHAHDVWSMTGDEIPSLCADGSDMSI